MAEKDPRVDSCKEAFEHSDYAVFSCARCKYRDEDLYGEHCGPCLDAWISGPKGPMWTPRDDAAVSAA